LLTQRGVGFGIHNGVGYDGDEEGGAAAFDDDDVVPYCTIVVEK